MNIIKPMCLIVVCLATQVVAAQEKADREVQKPVSKQETGLEQPKDVLESLIVTASREEQPQWEVPLAMSKVDEEQIQKNKPAHPSEIMARVSGAWVNITGGEGHMTAIRQPLSTSPLYLFLENGVPTRSTGFFNHNALYEVNLPMAGGLEVIKGPGSALHGSDAIGGVINVNTRHTPTQSEADLTVDAGEHGWQRYMVSAGDTFGANGLRVDANITRSEGWRDGTDYDREAGSVQWERPVGNGLIRTLATFSLIDQNTAGSSAISEQDYLNNPTINYTPFSLRNVEAFRVSMAYETLIGDNQKLSITPFLRNNSMELLPNWSLTYDPTIYTTENDSAGLQARYRVDILPMRTRIIVGSDVDYSPGSRVENRITPTREGKIFTEYQLAETIYNYDVDFLSTAAYAQAEFSPLENLRINAGLRYDSMSYDYQTHLNPIQSGRWRRPENTKTEYNRASPKLGFSWRLTPDFNLFASHRRAFRAPSEGQIFRQGSTDDTLGLKPVNARNTDLGIRGSLSSYVGFQLSAYRLIKKDDILRYEDPETGLVSSVNAGRTSHEGIELDLRFATGSLTLWLAGSYAEHRYEEWVLSDSTRYSGKEMPSAPRVIGNIGVEYRPKALQNLDMGLTWRQLGSYWMDPANTEKYDGHELLDLRVGYRIGSALEAVAQMRNLTDERYAERASYNGFRGRSTLRVYLEIYA